MWAGKRDASIHRLVYLGTTFCSYNVLKHWRWKVFLLLNSQESQYFINQRKTYIRKIKLDSLLGNITATGKNKNSVFQTQMSLPNLTSQKPLVVEAAQIHVFYQTPFLCLSILSQDSTSFPSFIVLQSSHKSPFLFITLSYIPYLSSLPSNQLLCICFSLQFCHSLSLLIVTVVLYSQFAFLHAPPAH